jgi:hypothetical protein
VQPTGCDFSEGEAVAQTAPQPFARSRRTRMKQRVLLTLIGLAIVLFALGGWVAQALRVVR